MSVYEETETVLPQALTQTTAEKLRQYISKLENLENEKAELVGQIQEVYGDAKALGFDTKALRTVIKIRKKDKKTRIEEEQMLDLYLHALGEI